MKKVCIEKSGKIISYRHRQKVLNLNKNSWKLSSKWNQEYYIIIDQTRIKHSEHKITIIEQTRIKHCIMTN